MRPTDETRKVKDMSTNERLLKLATADAATLAKVDAVLDHRDTNERMPETDTRTITFTQAAKRLGVSRPTVYRLTRIGRLRTVKLCGVNRVVLSSLTDFVNAGAR